MREFVYKVEYHFSRQPMSKIKELVSDHSTTLIEIINDAASAYKGVIPDDRWKEPYMSANELSDEIRAGVRFYGWFKNGFLLGIAGIQNVGSIDLIRPLLRVYCLPETRHRQRPATTPAESRADFHDFGWHVGRRKAVQFYQQYEARWFRGRRKTCPCKSNGTILGANRDIGCT
jgi:hypothetical protein